MIVDQAVYRDGHRVQCTDLQKELECLRADQQGFIWIGLKDPTDEEFALVNKNIQPRPTLPGGFRKSPGITDGVGGHWWCRAGGGDGQRGRPLVGSGPVVRLQWAGPAECVEPQLDGNAALVAQAEELTRRGKAWLRCGGCRMTRGHSSRGQIAGSDGTLLATTDD